MKGTKKMKEIKIQVDKELRPDIIFAMGQKIKTMTSYIIGERHSLEENSFREFESAYYSLKNTIDYLEIGE